MPATTTSPPAALFSPGFALNPEPTLTWLRQSDPLHELAPGVVVVTREGDCRAALVSPCLSAAGGQQVRQQRSGAATSMLNTDGAEHHRLRRPGMELLGTAAVTDLIPALDSVVHDIVAALATRDSFDLGTDLSEPVATAALSHALGIQDGPDQGRLATLFSEAAVALDPLPSPATAARGRSAVSDLESWLTTHLQRYPGGRLARLESAEVARADVLGIADLAVVGGWAPLVELLTTAMELALYDPAHRSHASSSRVGTWCEDVVRWHTPIPFVARRATESLVLPSGPVPGGAQVLIHIGAANRDPARFEEQDAVSATRARAHQHLAFGGGSHLCLGAPLVRALLPLTLQTFLRVLPHAHTRGTLFAWRPGIFPRRPLSTTVLVR